MRTTEIEFTKRVTYVDDNAIYLEDVKIEKGPFSAFKDKGEVIMNQYEKEHRLISDNLWTADKNPLFL